MANHPLQSSGQISMNDISIEIGQAGGSYISLNAAKGLAKTTVTPNPVTGNNSITGQPKNGLHITDWYGYNHVSLIYYNVTTYPMRICSDSSGNIFVSTSVNTITKITPSGVVTNNWATTGNSPRAICTDPAGNVYTANYNSTGTVTKVTPAGSSSVSWASGLISYPCALVSTSPSNYIYCAHFQGDLTRIVASTAAYTSQWAPLNDGVADICLDSAGNIYVATSNAAAGRLTKITPAGVATANYGNWTAVGGTPFLNDIVCDTSNNLFIVDTSTNAKRVIKVTSAGVATVFATTTIYIDRITIDPSNNLYVAGNSNTQNPNNAVIKITPSGVMTTFGYAYGPVFDLTFANGTVYTSDHDTSTVTKITAI